MSHISEKLTFFSKYWTSTAPTLLNQISLYCWPQYLMFAKLSEWCLPKRADYLPWKLAWYDKVRLYLVKNLSFVPLFCAYPKSSPVSQSLRYRVMTRELGLFLLHTIQNRPTWYRTALHGAEHNVTLFHCVGFTRQQVLQVTAMALWETFISPFWWALLSRRSEKAWAAVVHLQ